MKEQLLPEELTALPKLGESKKVYEARVARLIELFGPKPEEIPEENQVEVLE